MSKRLGMPRTTAAEEYDAEDPHDDGGGVVVVGWARGVHFGTDAGDPVAAIRNFGVSSPVVKARAGLDRSPL